MFFYNLKYSFTVVCQTWSRSLSDADLVQTEADSILFFLVKSESPQSRSTRAIAVTIWRNGLSSPPPPQGPAGTNYFENISNSFQSSPKMYQQPLWSPLLLFNLLLHTSFTIISCLISLHLAKTCLFALQNTCLWDTNYLVLYQLPSLHLMFLLFLGINLIQLYLAVVAFFFFLDTPCGQEIGQTYQHSFPFSIIPPDYSCTLSFNNKQKQLKMIVSLKPVPLNLLVSCCRFLSFFEEFGIWI